jgi:hypothetical protein
MKKRCRIYNLNFIRYIIMSNQTLTEYLRPFDNINQYLRALHIINCSYSRNEKSLDQITVAIKTIVNETIKDILIKQFVERVLLLPEYYGLHFYKDDIFESNVRTYLISNQRPTLVLSPDIDECIFCAQKLILQVPKFTKNPIVYSSGKIGDFCMQKNNYYFYSIISFLTIRFMQI